MCYLRTSYVCYMPIIDVGTYQVHVGDCWAPLNQLIATRPQSKLLVIVDGNTRRHCLPLLRQKLTRRDLTIISVPAGESFKHIDTCTRIWQQMLDAGADRSSLVINLGGGVIGDMGGFCAATFKRGMDFVQAPTTLLSQVDASIGGKLGVDFGALKNGIGLFRNPLGVFIEPAFLQSLPSRELRSGYAEVIKHSLIADATQWESLRRFTNLDQVNWSELLAPSLLIKQQIVSDDPYEKGARKALNFGHTIGHAVEGLALQSLEPLLHGEAIAIGMICETWLSHRLLGLPSGQLSDISSYLVRLYKPKPLVKNDFPAYLELIAQDKKNEGDEWLFSLIHPLGHAVINQPVSPQLIVESMAYFNQLIS